MVDWACRIVGGLSVWLISLIEGNQGKRNRKRKGKLLAPVLWFELRYWSLCFSLFCLNVLRSWYRWSGSSSGGRHGVCRRLLSVGHPHPLPPHHWPVRDTPLFHFGAVLTRPHTTPCVSAHNLLSGATTRSLLMDSLLPASRHSYFPNDWTNFLPNYSACNACTSSLLHSINFHRLSQTVVFGRILVQRLFPLVALY